ncbi:MAG: glutathione peroxidase [Oceanospirillaceae bacterium]|uniref:glutathione peroxidase n=1 Tax=unclassified Thalassolituus TaxID=2624967 RepID=UPI000C4B0E54|nr:MULTISPECIES: glutathione peroxidase [unclassified Thalassolituus]MAS24807.1 glutathione peroxidase [Oceanospirillaceae bacterium]MBS52285.1 glutathione peroxidase [Oceanospirillaceae bacterium]|tara:strand:+ start:27 stop:512 length:486 start_codon:yes stop_codon:yes gene_type:complete
MSVLEYRMPLLSGTEQDLSEYQGSVVLIVNTASECGFTYQYEGLEALYQQYKDQGLVILGFPCNQFGHQEKGDNATIGAFCQKNYGVSFPMFAKIEVNGDGAAPLYQQLKSEAPGLLGSKGIKWNFTKFLINRQGKVVKRYAPTTKPEKLKADIEAQLGSA